MPGAKPSRRGTGCSTLPTRSDCETESDRHGWPGHEGDCRDRSVAVTYVLQAEQHHRHRNASGDRVLRTGTVPFQDGRHPPAATRPEPRKTLSSIGFANRCVFILLVVMSAAVGIGPAGTAAAPAPKAPKGFLGIAPQENFDAIDTARMATGGVGAIRLPIAWSQVQPESGDQFDWGFVDLSFRAAAESGVPILPMLHATPSWVAPRTTKLPTTSSQLANWRNFVGAAVSRYGNGGTFWDEPDQATLEPTPPRSWQLWNEVNFHFFAFPVSPRDYARVAAAGSTMVRRNDRSAEVMLSGLFGRPKGPKKKALASPVFLKQLSRFLPGSKFDSIALHPYSPNMAQLRKLIADFRKTADRSGYRGTPINVTEIGWGSARKTNAFLTGSEKAQAKQLTSSLSFLIKARTRYRISSAYWYSWKDLVPGTGCNFCDSVGLFKSGEGLRPKKAWTSFIKLTGGRYG